MNGKAGGTVGIEILARGEFWELIAGGLFALMMFRFVFYRFLDNSDGTYSRVRAVRAWSLDTILEEGFDMFSTINGWGHCAFRILVLIGQEVEFLLCLKIRCQLY